MADYKEMYLKLFRATEEAISCLIAAQQECEALYINACDTQVQELAYSPWEDLPMEQDEAQLANRR